MQALLRQLRLAVEGRVSAEPGGIDNLDGVLRWDDAGVDAGRVTAVRECRWHYEEACRYAGQTENPSSSAHPYPRLIAVGTSYQTYC